ncbi:hypothetical protein C8Q80DRAFT_1216283 [Daedaleopsis nitida]|nr:hypothetical protein C8Q80DRAFT_1216283 [Daedaleopsis nitida]
MAATPEEQPDEANLSTEESNPGLPTDSRPPGGTRRSGAKTPRRVQWLAENDRTPSSRALDEQGLDPEAFNNLAHALEHHRSTSFQDTTPRDPSITNDPSSPSFGASVLSSPELSPMAEVPGEAYIDHDETAGLPGRDIEKYAQEQAEKVVRAHRFSFGLGVRHHPRSQGKSPHKKFFKDKNRSSAADVEKTAESRAEPSISQPTGVLSALLSMYDPPSPTQSGSTTPARSSIASSRPTSLYGGFGSDASSVALMPRRDDETAYGTSNVPSGSSHRPKGLRSLSFAGARDSKTHTGGGVFAPLIASTGNIAGVAAPVPATVAPDLKRPGYHISRYSLDSNLRRRNKPSTMGKPNLHYDPLAETASSSNQSSSETAVSASRGNGTLSGRRGWNASLKDLPKAISKGFRTPASSPESEVGALNYGSTRAEKKRKRRKAEIWITRHVAEIVCRQEFILKFARAMMMFGGPSHRLQAQVKSTAKVLEVELSCLYLPDVMLISFDDPTTGTSSIKFIRQESALDIGKLQEAHGLYWEVIHDKTCVKEASAKLDALMRRLPLYNSWQMVLVGGASSALICIVSFHGSFVDSLLYANVFEITVATLFSFIAAALDTARFFCYSAIASSSVVLILPGFIVLCGSLELSSRNIVSGAVRVCYACIYSLFLGFGLAIGATAYTKFTSHRLGGTNDLQCDMSHDPNGPWWQRTPSLWWAFLTVPLYSLFSSLRIQAPWNRRELYLLVVISCIGWVTNHYTGIHFPNQNDVSAAVGALAVGFISNLYGRFFNGNAFVVMITGILFQLPSGLANGGLFTFVQRQTDGSATSDSYLSGFRTALQLISVSIGLTVGLGISLVLVHPIPSRKRAAGLFSL